MKIQSRRAAIVLFLLGFFIFGIIFFVSSYLKNASTWVFYSGNKHIYTNGRISTGKIYDRNGLTLFSTEGGKIKYNSNQTIRTAVMHTVGDSEGNVSTGAQYVFKKQLSGWNLVNGVYSGNGSGSSVSLTIDAKLCAAAYKALAGRHGTVGVYNYKTGDILCMVSTPSFDPEDPPKVDPDSEKYEGIYMNRLLSSTYTPGSVFKLVTLAAAIDNISGVANRTFKCTGTLKIDDGKVTCPSSHGRQNLSKALANSCNTTFAELATEVGANQLQEYAKKAGFNSVMYIDGIKTAQGKVDVTTASKVDLGWAGIGQYTDTANPATFMAYMGAIANNGVRVTPKLLLNSKSQQTRVLSSDTADMIKTYMRNDTLLNYGEKNYPGLHLCAKSGTAQLNGQQPNAWFAGFLDRKDCPLAFVVVVENGGAGSKVSGPIAGKVLQEAVKIYAGKM